MIIIDIRVAAQKTAEDTGFSVHAIRTMLSQVLANATGEDMDTVYDVAFSIAQTRRSLSDVQVRLLVAFLVNAVYTVRSR